MSSYGRPPRADRANDRDIIAVYVDEAAFFDATMEVMRRGERFCIEQARQRIAGRKAQPQPQPQPVVRSYDLPQPYPVKRCGAHGNPDVAPGPCTCQW